MKNRIKLLTIISITIVILIQSFDVDAQRRRRSRPDQSSESLSERIWYGINLGNLDFFGSSLSLSGKFTAAYKINNQLSAGLGVKTFYDFFEFPGDDLSLFSYGGGPFARFKITNEIYVQGEYNISSYEEYNINSINSFREDYTYPLIGGGYESGRGKWKYGLNILFVLSEEVRELNVKNSLVEWWISFSYNF